MEPGRELDALIAEKVFGWKHELTPMGYLWFCYQGHPQANANKGRECPNYSTDIAAAWEVVEHFKSKRMVYMECRNTTDGRFRWRISWTDTVMAGTENEFGEMEREGEAIAKTAPHAICLAAFKAAGE